ncbi:MAG: pilin [Gammaproteobacteria bacterium]|nr:pilin [Gammaproteobacteria bacterium]
MDNKKYNVTILQTPVSEPVTTQLSKLFKISADKSQQILQKDSFIIKKQTDKITAEKFHKAITAAGVNCQIDEIIAEAETALPEIEEIENTAKVKPLTDITRPDITPLHQENINLSLEDGVPEKNNSSSDPAKINDINPENFCPQCGTIRASADSTCIHCGYNPQELKKSKTKTTLISATIIILLLGIGIGIGFPFYQQYSKRAQIIEDLKLAFDTRNKVTEFIQKTNFWPNQNIDADLDKRISNRTLKSVVVGNNAIITATLYGHVIDGTEQTLIFTPNILKGRIVWNCLKGTLKEEFRPEICITRSQQE